MRNLHVSTIKEKKVSFSLHRHFCPKICELFAYVRETLYARRQKRGGGTKLFFSSARSQTTLSRNRIVATGEKRSKTEEEKYDEASFFAKAKVELKWKEERESHSFSLLSQKNESTFLKVLHRSSHQFPPDSRNAC